MTGRKLLVFVASACVVAYVIFLYGPVRSILIGSVSGLAVVALGYLQRRSAKERDGWAYLTPSPMEWVAVIAIPPVVIALALVYFFVGSARPDAASQMLALKCMILGFSLVGALAIYHSLCIATRWNKDRIQQRDPVRGPKVIEIADIVALRASPIWQTLRIESSDGSVIRVSLGQNGVDDLIELLITELKIGEPAEESGAD